MDITLNACNALQMVTSGTGIIGISNQPVYLQGVFVGHASAQAIAFYSGQAIAATMAIGSFAARQFHPFPLAGPTGITVQPLGNPGDADLRLTFFWVPGQRT